MLNNLIKIAREIGFCVGLLFSYQATGLWMFVTLYVLFFKGN